jgi:hypothetical protein
MDDVDTPHRYKIRIMIRNDNSTLMDDELANLDDDMTDVNDDEEEVTASAEQQLRVTRAPLEHGFH